MAELGLDIDVKHRRVCTTAFVIATFSSYGRAEPSTMTDGKPA